MLNVRKARIPTFFPVSNFFDTSIYSSKCNAHFLIYNFHVWSHWQVTLHEILHAVNYIIFKKAGQAKRHMDLYNFISANYYAGSLSVEFALQIYGF